MTVIETRWTKQRSYIQRTHVISASSLAHGDDNLTRDVRQMFVGPLSTTRDWRWTDPRYCRGSNNLRRNSVGPASLCAGSEWFRQLPIDGGRRSDILNSVSAINVARNRFKTAPLITQVEHNARWLTYVCSIHRSSLFRVRFSNSAIRARLRASYHFSRRAVCCSTKFREVSLFW